MKKLIAIAVLLVVAIVVVAYWSRDQQPAQKKPVAVANNQSQSPAQSQPASQSQPPQAQIHMHEFAAKGRVPAFHETLPGKLPNTLSPDIFTGNQKLAYQAAKEIPEVLAQLPCYCHCDRGHGHKSLHSCFEDEHGENCGICIGEALMAQNLHRNGVGVPEIRKRIIAAYGDK